MSHSNGTVPGTTAAGITLVIDPKTMWPLMALRGVLAILFGIAAAVVTVLWPAITILALTVLAAAVLIAVGVAELVVAVRLRKLIRGEVFMALAGLAGVIAGILILIWPLSGALVLTIMLGAYALVSGILLLFVAWRLRRIAQSPDVTRSARAGAGSARRPQPHTP